MLLVANLAIEHDRVQMIFKNLYVLVRWTKVASALEGLKCCNSRVLVIKLTSKDFKIPELTSENLL